MGMIDLTFRTITCNNSDKCGHTITYNRQEEKQTFEAKENIWLKSVRQVTTLDQRVLAYCSDACEIEGVATGTHNLPEPKRIISEAASPVAVKAAADAAKAAEQAQNAIRQGSGITIAS